jgi:3-(methylthio)propionyl---CoA ligase
MASPYDVGLDKNPANFAPLTPLQFLDWSASARPRRTSLLYMDRRFTWAETHARCRQLASALAQCGIGRGDSVAAMLWNTPEMFECQFGVPMSGAVLNTINVRLDAPTIVFMLDHGEAKVLITDRAFSQALGPALSMCEARPLVIDVDDPGYTRPGVCLGETDYETFLATGDPAHVGSAPQDEWDAIALNYTSGTTGPPEGRSLSPPRRLPRCTLHRPCRRHPTLRGLPLDRPDVSLQRLVLPVRWRRLPAPACAWRRYDARIDP